MQYTMDYVKNDAELLLSTAIGNLQDSDASQLNDDFKEDVIAFQDAIGSCLPDQKLQHTI